MASNNTKNIVLIALVAAVVFMVFSTLGPSTRQEKPPRPGVSDVQADQMGQNLLKEAQPARQTVMKLFANHKIVYLGYLSFGFIREETEFVTSLLPMLAENAVEVLAVDFLLADDQPKIDDLMTKAVFDEPLAKRLLSNRHPLLSSQQQLDMLKQAWLTNHPDGQNMPSTKLRVIGLAITWNVQLALQSENNTDPELARQIMFNGLPDNAYARIMEQEAVAPNKKALVYVQRESTLFGFVEPAYKLHSEAFGLGDGKRMARILEEKYPGIGANIMFHTPWQDLKSSTGAGYPAGGNVDAALSKLNRKDWPAMPFALDFQEGSMSQLPIKDSSYNQAQPFKVKDKEIQPPPAIELQLKNLASVYVVLGNIGELNVSTPIPGFVDVSNLEHARKFLPPKEAVVNDPSKVNTMIEQNFAQYAQLLSQFK